MFTELNLKSTYSSYEDNIGENFYSPVLSKSIKYDRATAYFSANALASYASGLEYFAKKGHIYRLIISSQLSREDYEQIKLGNDLKHTINESLIESLRESLSLEEERNISNLAFLISVGVIEIKIAFTTDGIFHDKFGIAEDEFGNVICFRGSNNETTAAFEKNYESFDITCSWQSSSFDYSKITRSQKTFDKLWNNDYDSIFVKEIDEVVYSEISKFNKGNLIMDSVELEKNCIILDFDSTLCLHFKIDPTCIINNSVYKLKLKRYVTSSEILNNTLFFKQTLTYPDFKRIITILENDAKKRNYRFFTTTRLRNYIISREMHIKKRANLGISIKNYNEEVIDKYLEYKAIVDSVFIRKLRDKQMWDSFFMCTMKKASNFSVPGSGKTASVLGVFAYLYAKGLVNKIVMVGPKNSFGSWSDEFNLCFGENLILKLFNIQDQKYKSKSERKTALLFESGSANLVLLNYESLRSYITECIKLVDSKTLLVFDEVHKVKAISGSNAAKSIELSRNAMYTIALTGTPIPNSYTDIYNLLDILYHDEYNDFFGFSIQELKNPSASDIEVINQKIQPFFCRTTKKQLNVPEANTDNIYKVTASTEENKLFHILCLKYSKNKFALIIRLLQLSSNPKMLLKTIDLSDFGDILDISLQIDDIDYIDYSDEVLELINKVDYTSKFNICIDTAMSLYNEGKTSIIWCIFIDSIHRIAQKLESNGLRVGCIYGATTMDERQNLLNKFREKELDVLITNPHTLAESVSLHKTCHDAIYYEYSYNLVHHLQSKDRIHRLGLLDGQYTQYYYLQEEYTTIYNELYSLDEQILIRLQDKENIMLDAIENNTLETVSTPQEDLDLIFTGLNL
ncbi:SNF2-related protein [Proteiniclasticum sp. C24MP]|uniref:SNF2-related protein n=1 Tax=Proteiniclasticum sp. C24MP TaxID=3374101 RepID=UPI00375503AC